MQKSNLQTQNKARNTVSVTVLEMPYTNREMRSGVIAFIDTIRIYDKPNYMKFLSARRKRRGLGTNHCTYIAHPV